MKMKKFSKILKNHTDSIQNLNKTILYSLKIKVEQP